ncbi:MAG: ferritin family protein [Thermodesulfobacteriota bacterium]
MDPAHFSAQEILEMAVDIEENGEKFYTAASDAATNPSLKELFTFLAEEEKRHVKFFTSLKKDASDAALPGAFDPYPEEASLYLKALADSKVFTAPEEGGGFAKAAENETTALSYAIDMEKESLLFYFELQNAIREKDRKTLGEIINEEKEHLKKLTGMKMELSG